MPELPDIAAYITASNRTSSGSLEHVRVASAFLLRTVQPPLASIEGHVVRELRRVGSGSPSDFDNDLWLVLHLMIAGRLHWRLPGAKLDGRNNLGPSTSQRLSGAHRGWHQTQNIPPRAERRRVAALKRG